MPTVEATIEYETENNQKNKLLIMLQHYTPVLHSRFSENEQKQISIQQKKPDELHIKFYIMTYSEAVLKQDGQFEPEKIEDARETINDIKKLMHEVGKLGRQPICTLKWGDECFNGILTKLDYQYTIFAPDGKPVCVNCNAIFKEWIAADKALKNDNTKQSNNNSKFRTVNENTNLCDIAHQEYNDPGNWRLIAEKNGIIDPIDLKSGKVLALPPNN